MIATVLIVLGLATWRLTSLFVWETGPFNIFQRIREKVGILHDETGHPYQYPDTFFAQLLSCVWCFSIWVAFFSVFYWIFPGVTIAVAMVPAISAIAILIDHFCQSS